MLYLWVNPYSLYVEVTTTNCTVCSGVRTHGRPAWVRLLLRKIACGLVWRHVAYVPRPVRNYFAATMADRRLETGSGEYPLTESESVGYAKSFRLRFAGEPSPPRRISPESDPQGTVIVISSIPSGRPNRHSEDETQLTVEGNRIYSCIMLDMNVSAQIATRHVEKCYTCHV